MGQSKPSPLPDPDPESSADGPKIDLYEDDFYMSTGEALRHLVPQPKGHSAEPPVVTAGLPELELTLPEDLPPSQVKTVIRLRRNTPPLGTPVADGAKTPASAPANAGEPDRALPELPPEERIYDQTLQQHVVSEADAASRLARCNPFKATKQVRAKVPTKINSPRPPSNSVPPKERKTFDFDAILNALGKLLPKNKKPERR